MKNVLVINIINILGKSLLHVCLMMTTHSQQPWKLLSLSLSPHHQILPASCSHVEPPQSPLPPSGLIAGAIYPGYLLLNLSPLSYSSQSCCSDSPEA